MTRFFCTEKGSDLDISISLGVTSSFEFCICLPQHSWDLVLDDIQVLISPAKVLHFPCSLRKHPNSAAHRTPESQKINSGKDTDSYKSDNGRQQNDKVSAQTTNHSASAAFDSTRMSK